MIITTEYLSLNKNKILWLLYDFANSIIFVNISFYLSTWIIKDLGLSDLYLSLPIALSALVLLILMPKIGAHTDVKHNKTKLLSLLSSLFVLSSILMGAHNVLGDEPNKVIITISIFLFYLFYQSALAMYNSLLRQTTSVENLSSMSGLGFGIGQIGNILGIGVATLILKSDFYNTNLLDKGFIFLFSSLISFLLMLPTFFIKDKHFIALQEHEYKISDIFKLIKKDKKLLYFLISFSLFADAALTLQIFISSYMTISVGISDKNISTTVFLGLIMIVLMSFITPKLLKFFKVKELILGLILTWFFILQIISINHNIYIFYLMMLINFGLYGSLFTLSRAYFSEITPEEAQGKYFGIYTIFERGASIIGPLLWSFTVLIFKNTFGLSTSMRINIFALSLMMLLSFYFFRKHTKYTYGQ